MRAMPRAAVALLRRSGVRWMSDARRPPQLMKGMLVVELANVLAGPTVCQFLAELGADVVKVENMATRGDVTRTWRLRNDDGSSVSAYFRAANLGKRSIGIDARKEEGLDVLRRLTDRADVVVASYKPGDAEKLGLDASTLRERNRRLVYAQITGYGLQNPRAGYDAVIQAESGFQYMNGEPDSSPTKMPVALMDLLAAHQLKQAVLMALWDRERTGEGAHCDVSLIQAGVSALANQATGYLTAGAVPQRMGSDHPSICPYGTVFSTGDGKQLVLGVGSDKQFRQLCEELGEPGLADDERFRTNPLRVKNRDECKTLIRNLIRKVPSRAEFLASLNRRAVPAGAVNNMQEVFELPEAEQLVVRDDAGKPLGVRQVAAGFAGVSSCGPDVTEAPQYASGTSYVLEHYLGIGQDRFRELEKAGVVCG